MFYEFTSNHVFDSSQWHAIWEIENRIAALLMDDPKCLNGYDERETIEFLKKYLSDERGFPTAELGKGDHAQTLIAFLRRECSHIKKWAEGPSGQIADPILFPNENLRMCIQESPEFRQYVDDRGAASEAAMARFRQMQADGGE